MNIREMTALKQVKDDLDEGRRFYDSNKKELGDYFYDSLISDIESLRIYSGIHSQHWGLYRMLSKRFPFAVYYVIQGETTIVVAVLDLRRDPVWLQGKLKSRNY